VRLPFYVLRRSGLSSIPCPRLHHSRKLLSPSLPRKVPSVLVLWAGDEGTQLMLLPAMSFRSSRLCDDHIPRDGHALLAGAGRGGNEGTHVVLVIDLEAGKALGLTILPSMLVRADQVIER